MMHCHAVSIDLSTCRTIFLLVSLFDIVLSTLTIESSSFLPSSSSSVRSYDTLYGDHFISDSYINADRLRQFGTNIANEQTLKNEDSALYSGPVFVFEPEQREQYPLKYNNVTSAAITCKVSGYPTPRIDWRVDNITIAFNNHGPLKDHETWSGQQLFVPLLNSIVTLRNDGQTLLVGGEANGTGLYQSSSFHSHHPFMSSSFASASLSSSTSGTSMSHQIECLATNQFGSIVSRPVFVQQQQQQQGIVNSQSVVADGSTTLGVMSNLNPFNGMKESVTLPSISVQLYDEFVSRGNVAVLKCLVLNVANGVGTVSGSLSSSPFLSSSNSIVSTDDGTNVMPVAAKLHSPLPKAFTSSYQYQRSYQGSINTANYRSGSADNINNLVHEFVFEWRIKNGPASQASTGETILTLRSNQTQGKYTAYPTGELHVRDVDEHDARRTYQCVIYPKSHLLSSLFNSFSGYGKKFGSNTNELHYHQQQQSSRNNGGEENYVRQTKMPVESTFAQIILSGSEKDVFPPRIVHRYGSGSISGPAEIFADNGQLESILLPCAGQAQPLPTYRWFWIPLSNGPFDWEAELSSMALHQSSSGTSSSGALPHSYAIALPVQTVTSSSSSSSSLSSASSSSSNGQSSNVDQMYRRHQMSLSRIRTFGGGSTVLIPGPISQIDSGHYVALVQNTIGYDRCITTLYVRTPLSIRMEWSSLVSSFATSQTESSPKLMSDSTNRARMIRAIRGERIQLRCIVNGFPVSDLYWLHNGMPLTTVTATTTSNGNEHGHHHHQMQQQQQQQQQSSSGSSLPQHSDGQSSTIQTIELHFDEQHKSGMYQCFARNRFQVVQTSVQIVVIDQPPSIVEKFSDITVQPGDFVTLRCTSLAAPLAQIYWSIDGQTLPNSARYRFGDFVVGDRNDKQSSTARLVSHFNITSVRVEDGGLYRCTAKNIAGTVYHQARLNVYGKVSTKPHLSNITVLSNSDVELNCPFYGFPVKTITWFGRDGSSRKLPINGRQYISPNGTLHISKVNKKEDEGSFECEVQQENGPLAKARIHLKVITGPRIDNFTFASNLEEGMRSVAICAVISGDSPIRISWLKDGIQLMSSSTDSNTLDFKIEMVNEFTSSITFTALKRKHAGRYTCIASNPAASDQHSADLKVNVAPLWLMEPKDIVAISGQRIVIDCQAEGIPEPQIRWKMESFDTSSVTTRNGVTTGSDSNELMYQKSNSNSAGNSNAFHAVISNPHIQILENGSLFIKDVQREDHRRYMCSAFNGVGSGISTIIRLSVNFPPQFIYGYFEAKSIKLSESIVLICLAKVEHIEPVVKNVTSNSKLQDSNSLMMEMRWYKLDSKSNPVGQHLDSISHDRYHITSTFELSDPSPLLHNTSSSLPSNEHTLYYVTKLTIRQVERTDSGSYLCTAQNHFGFVRKNYTITVLEVPDKPNEIRTESVTSTTIKLNWMSPFDGNSAITEYVISYRALTSTVPNTVSVSGSYSNSESRTSATISGSKKWIAYQLIDLIPFTSYSIQIKAKNSIGYSSFSDTITIKTAEEPPSEVVTDVTILPLNTRSLKISWRKPRYKSSKTNHILKGGYIPPITGYYIGYRSNQDSIIAETGTKFDGNNEFVFKTVKSSTSSVDSDSETFVLNNLKRATRYDIKIQAFNLAGAGPSTSELLGKTLDFDVPNAPRIRALRSNLSSIELVWSVQGDEPISGFVISYKPASANELSTSINDISSYSTNNDLSNEWKTIKLEVENESNDDVTTNSKTTPDSSYLNEKRILYEGSTVFHRRTYVLGGLRCGTKYFIYVNAYNQVGQGDPSEVILSRTEGNVPIAPELTQEFLSSNMTHIRLNLNQWKKLGCPIDLFEIDYRLYGDVSSNQKVTYRPHEFSLSEHKFAQHQMIKKDEPYLKLPENDTINDDLYNYEIFNLSPGSWYELIVKAQTEAGYMTREYLFSTLKLDGSTVAPLTLKAVDGSVSKGDSSGSFLSIRSNLFAQLHYIVPVSCTLFILFLVTVVVCAIHTTHQQRQLHPQDPHHHHHFLLSFMTNRNVRSDKEEKTICSNSSTSNSGHYTSSSGGTTTAGSCAGDHPGGSLMMMLHDTNDLQDDYCTGKHGDERYAKSMSNGVGNRSDSCHSLGGCGGHHEHGQPSNVHVQMIKSTTNCDSGKTVPPLPPSSKSTTSFPLYNLPVPYATSAVQQFNTKTEMNGNEIYGTTGTACHYNKGQLNEMYCDNIRHDPPVGMVLLEQTNHTTYGTNRNAIDSNGIDSNGGNVHNINMNGNHQYELPFVFKNIPHNHNESTAF